MKNPQIPKIPQKTFNQLVAFLLNCEPDSELVPLVGYTWDETLWSQYKLVIYPSKFFTDRYYGLPRSMPSLPLKMLGNMPILFGEPDVVKINDTLVVYADVIASSYFLLSRYEELVVQDNRDEHGRFQGKRSVTDGVMHRPMVDEYGKLLRGWLRECGVEVPEPPEKIKKIYLTHDIDVPYIYRSFRQLGGTFLKRRNEFLPALKGFLGKLENDPFYTYPFILEQNEALKSACNDSGIPIETIFFLKAGEYPKERYDQPYYNLRSKDMQRIIALIKQSGAKIGLHTSYTAGDMALLSVYENEILQKAVDSSTSLTDHEEVTYNRYHYLRNKNAEDMQCLPLAGITDDFTVGYADMAGFRLGTSRPVNWINLKTKTFGDSLTLHPLTMMDCTLSAERYMNLSYEWAFNYATELIDQVKKHNGELVLLWHNSIFAEDTAFDHRKFYVELLEYIKENQ
ncbi:MAG: polysaccharide deacetylase family protein [Prevotellaceae bacterium]|jgi:hypothetical protein|nr:polysaccharide deacetylase family protein [Prevotellaceae bacterium]